MPRRHPVALRGLRGRRAFSLIELIVVISVASVLMALLMPAMSQIRENAHRVICSNNQHQLGTALVLYHDNNRDQLPRSAALHEDNMPQELMAARRSLSQNNTNTISGWDGLGLLYYGHYCPAAQSFYCPSHHGSNPYERYADFWDQAIGPLPLFTNYHYCGDMDWNTHAKRRLFDGYELVLITDGLRSASDFNHYTGMNVLRGDGSVRWRENVQSVVNLLPLTEGQQVTGYHQLWSNFIENPG